MAVQAPERVDRFKVLRRLGAGGMGEVYLAEDLDLGRHVALKSLQTTANDSTLQERLRQEARTVAAINHPSVGLIYDLVVTDDQSYLVLEHVEGTSLASLLGDGPLPVETVVQVGLDVAEGLEAAHRLGIVHRDLKPENVMITPAGRAKILDFGLATALREQGCAPDAGLLAGTLSAMSPEQVEQGRVDERSDLFSLGTLLYHMVAGEHPFRTGVPVETMQRICHHEPAPAGEGRPDGDAALSRLIGWLLRKAPEQRPATSQVVEELRRIRRRLGEQYSEVKRRRRRSRLVWRGTVGALVVAAAAWLTWRLVHQEAPAPLTVAVLRVEDQGAVAPPELLLSAVRLAVVNTLAGLEGVHVVSTGEVDAVAGGRAEVVRETAADEVVTASLSASAATSLLEVTRVDGATGSTLWSGQVEVPNDDVMLVSETVSVHLTRAYQPRRRRPGASEVAASPEDLAAFLVTREKVLNPTGDTSWPEVLGELEIVRRSSPRLLNVYVLEASVARYLYETTRDELYLDHARDVISHARDVAPADYRTVFAAAEVAVACEPYDRAATEVAELERLEPANPAVIRLKARLAEVHGKNKEAGELLTRLVERQPSWRNLLSLAKVERLLGDVSSARRHLSEAQERSRDNVTLLGERAHLELMVGDVAVAEELLLELATRSPDALHLTRLGTAQVLRGRPTEALKSYQHALALGARAPLTSFNLGDCYTVLGDREEAARWYRQALAALGQDQSVKGKELKAKSLAQLGELDAAVAVIGEALAMDPGSPETNFSAAVVFSLAGQKRLAREHAERALAAGLSPAWLSYPWVEWLQGE